MVMLGRKGNHVRQCPHGFTHPGPFVIVEVQIPVPVHMGLGCPQTFKGRRHKKDFHQAQIQTNQLEGVVRHDEPPGPAIHKGLRHRQLPLAVLAASQVMGPMAHLVERLNPLQHLVLRAATVGKQVKRTMQEFFDAEEGNQGRPEILALQPGKRTSASREKTGQSQSNQQQHQRALNSHHHESGKKRDFPVLASLSSFAGAARKDFPDGGDNDEGGD